MKYSTRADAPDKWEGTFDQLWMKRGQEQQLIQASADTATRPSNPKTTQQGKVSIEVKQQSRKRLQGAPGTNVHSAHAGISVHNALLNLGPPAPEAKVGSKHLPWLQLTDWEMMNLRKRMKKNAKWKPSDEMIKKELAEIGRGPLDYAKAKEEAMSLGSNFLDEDSVDNQGSHRKTSVSDQPFLEPNLGMKLNQAKKRKREAQIPPSEGPPVEGSVTAHAAKKQRLQGSDAAPNGRMTVPGSERDRAYQGVYRVSAGKANNECVEPNQKLAMVRLCVPSIEIIKPIVGHGKESERIEVGSDDVMRVVEGGPGADVSGAGKTKTLGSDVLPAATVGLGPKKSISLSKPPLAARSRTALTAPTNTVVPIDPTAVSSTDSDASSDTSTEHHEMSAPPTSLDESPSSKSSAESSLGEVSLPPPEMNSSDKPPSIYGLGLDDSSEMANGADTRAIPGGDQSLLATSATATNNIYPGKLGSTRTSSSPGKDKDLAHILTPKDDTRAILVNPATTNTMTHGPMSLRTPLDRQAREIVFAAVTRAIELGEPFVDNAVKKSQETSLPNPKSAAVLPTTQLGNAHGSNVPKTAIPRLNRPGEDEALSNLTPGGNGNVYATTSTSIKPETAIVDNRTGPETNTSREPELVVSTQALLQGSLSSCVNQGQDQLRLKQTIESAVAESKELGDPVFGHAVRKLYEQSLRNPTIADLLVAVLMQKPLPAQSAEFASRIRAARNRHREHQVSQNSLESNFSMFPSSSRSLVSGGRSIHHNTTPMVCNNQSPSTGESADPPNTLKLPLAHHTEVPMVVVEGTDVASPDSPLVTSSNSSTPSTSTATSIAPSTAISNPSNSRSPLTNKPTNTPNSIMLPSPCKSRVSIGVPGGSGVMAFNRARRRARISAGESGNLVATQQARTPDGAGKKYDINADMRHQRLRDFVVNGRVT